VRSSLDLGNNLCVVVALRHVSLPLFYILVFLAPLVITVLASIFLHEKIGTGKAIAVVAGFAGVIVAVNPFGNSRQGDWIGFGACMVCVACFSINMVWSRVLTRTETAESLTFFSGLVMALAGFGAMVWHTEPIGGRWLVALLAMGLFCAVGSISFFVALKHTTASNVSQYHYTQLLTGSAVSYLIWRQLPTLSMMAGGALIVGAGLYVALRGARVGVADHG
jgi:drug/metabolite transporter (DMT)-like permease